MDEGQAQSAFVGTHLGVALPGGRVGRAGLVALTALRSAAVNSPPQRIHFRNSLVRPFATAIPITVE